MAVKIINKKKIKERKTYISLLENEMAILAWLNHPNLLKINDLLEDKFKFYMVSEILWGGSVIDYIRRYERMEESKAKVIVKQVMKGLYYMHSNNVIHRDLKLENIIFS
mmetsp:Transcript_32174/g.49207  ORF Transcript_32174/g.49207 Transcript_32174/m.49207 type:complete len:109 (-) Transcript_32174:461-787(-)